MAKEARRANETMTVQQVCELLGISRATLMRRVKEGVIVPLPKPPLLKRHHRLKFRRADVENLVRDA